MPINHIEVKAMDTRLNMRRYKDDCDLSSTSLSSSSCSSCQKSMKRRRKGYRSDYERRSRGTKRHKKQKKHSREFVDKTEREPGAQQKMEALRRRQMERNKRESIREFTLREG